MSAALDKVGRVSLVQRLKLAVQDRLGLVVTRECTYEQALREMFDIGPRGRA